VKARSPSTEGGNRSFAEEIDGKHNYHYDKRAIAILLQHCLKTLESTFLPLEESFTPAAKEEATAAIVPTKSTNDFFQSQAKVNKSEAEL
jgi:hypothetical protein